MYGRTPRKRLVWLVSACLASGCDDGGTDIDLGGYDTGCRRDDDCILVAERDVCTPCAGADLVPVAYTERGRYEAEVATACGGAVSGEGDGCAPPARVRPACIAGTCGTEPASCGDGACDHYEWDPRETAVSCPADCRCGDGVCDTTERTGNGACAKDCPTTGAGG